MVGLQIFDTVIDQGLLQENLQYSDLKYLLFFRQDHP